MRHAVPTAIVISGILIAIAVFFVQKQPVAPVAPTPVAPQVRVPSVRKDDHVRGNPNEPVVIIEYSDTECPYCKEFHATLRKVIDAYGKNGQVAWVFRNFPVTDSHPKALKEAQALECAADLGGELVFWRYLDRIYEITPSNDGLDPAALNTVANEMGLDVRAFASCVESGKHVAAIQKSSAEAIAAGAAGTPFSILMYGADEYVIQGSQTYDYMQGLLEILIASDSEASTSASAL
jgi:protein-disulfide isomerase